MRLVASRALPVRRMIRPLASPRLRCCCLAAPAFGAAIPAKPVKIIVPFAAGGPVDVVARMVGQKLSEKFGQQFVIENQVGAGGNIGMGNGARAAPDGYTILFVSSSYVVNPSLYAKVPYDPYKDLIPLDGCRRHRQHVDRARLGAGGRSVKELVAVMKANPGKYNNYRACRRRHHAASLGRTVPAHGRRRHGACAVCRRRPGDPVDGRGPHADHVHDARARDAAHQGRQAALARGDGERALAASARRADHGGGGLSRIRKPTPLSPCLMPAGTPKPIVDLVYGEIIAALKMPDVRAALRRDRRRRGRQYARANSRP